MEYEKLIEIHMKCGKVINSLLSDKEANKFIRRYRKLYIKGASIGFTSDEGQTILRAENISFIIIKNIK